MISKARTTRRLSLEKSVRSSADDPDFEKTEWFPSPVQRLAKRTLDLSFVFISAVLIAPVLVVIAVVVKVSSPGPVFYAQDRIGRGGRRFRLWKFRTMCPEAEDILEDYLLKNPELRRQWEVERKLQNDPRVNHRVGRFLRKSSLDELPQLWNVLRGEMSLVGPRPLPQFHLDQFDPRFRRFRETLTPGMTGMWQVYSRHNGSPEMFVKHDRLYIRDWSLLLDLEILLRTFGTVLSGRGAR
jgi:lipopolysaccharide/colanic/teichoic acid biosynthesis glycosyltransferase